MQNSMGIDPSLTSTGIVILDKHAKMIVHQAIVTKNLGDSVRRRMTRYQPIIARLDELLRTYQPEIVTIEGYAFGSRTGQVCDRAELGGLVRWSVLASGCPCYEVNPATLKKYTTGVGKGDKTATVAALTSKYGVQFSTDDEYDAYSLSRMGLQLLEYMAPENAHQRDSLAKVRANFDK